MRLEPAYEEETDFKFMNRFYFSYLFVIQALCFVFVFLFLFFICNNFYSCSNFVLFIIRILLSVLHLLQQTASDCQK